MRPFRSLRQTQWWRELTDEQISPTATILPLGTRSPLQFLTAFGLLSAFLGVASWFMGSEFAFMAQWLYYFILLSILPALAIDFSRWRWGPNSSPALVALPLALLSLPNLVVARFSAWYMPAVSEYSKWSDASYIIYAVAVGVAYWLMLFWRARVVGHMRAEAEYQRARADEAERDRQALAARLTTLQAQIEPSFLSDTLRNVQQLVAHQPAEAVVMLTNLILEVTGQQHERETLLQQARVDALTGLPNRRAFEDLLGQAHKQAVRAGGRVALLFLDLDDFKRINDTLGHSAGDAALRAFAQRIRAAVREVDVVARLGGDEFVVLLDTPQTDDATAIVARKIEDALATPLALGDSELAVRASIGVAEGLATSMSPTDLINAADAAMYADKARRKTGLAGGKPCTNDGGCHRGQ